MAWISDVNGITIKNFLKKRTILYKDLESVFIDDTSIEFITREGEKIAQKRGIFDDFTALYEAIKKYNISFRNEKELADCIATYTIDEINEKAGVIKEYVYGLMKEPIKSKYGDEYDVSLEIEDEDEFVVMYFCLTKSGKAVEFLSPFDHMFIAFLVEWDTALGYGNYSTTHEVDDEEACKCLVQSALDYLDDYYKAK